VRRSKEGPRVLQATDTSSLMPGDVVKIVATASTVPGKPERMLPELLRAGTN
jgi:hypothetical protein